MNTSVEEPKKPLTPRELQVLQVVSKGYTDKEVARLLGVAPGTVGELMRRALKKLEMKNRVQAAVWAAKKGLL